MQSPGKQSIRTVFRQPPALKLAEKPSQGVLLKSEFCRLTVIILSRVEAGLEGKVPRLRNEQTKSMLRVLGLSLKLLSLRRSKAKLSLRETITTEGREKEG